MRHGIKALLRWTAAPVAAALILTACTTATPYQPRVRGSEVSGGYSEQRIEADRFRVTFTGNSLTSRERVENYLLYRAAELTRQAGFDGFSIVTRTTDPTVRTRSTGFGGPYGYWSPYWRYRYGGYWHFWDPWGPDPFWNDVDIRTVTSFEASAEIVMFRGRRPDDRLSFDAEEVLRNLGPTIQYPDHR